MRFLFVALLTTTPPTMHSSSNTSSTTGTIRRRTCASGGECGECARGAGTGSAQYTGGKGDSIGDTVGDRADIAWVTVDLALFPSIAVAVTDTGGCRTRDPCDSFASSQTTGAPSGRALCSLPALRGFARRWTPARPPPDDADSSADGLVIPEPVFAPSTLTCGTTGTTGATATATATVRTPDSLHFDLDFPSLFNVCDGWESRGSPVFRVGRRRTAPSFGELLGDAANDRQLCSLKGGTVCTSGAGAKGMRGRRTRRSWLVSALEG
eukprot:Opistho-2@71147